MRKELRPLQKLDAEFVVAIPSYDRTHTIRAKTLALVRKHGIPKEQVYIFVADERELNRYKLHLGSDWPNIVKGVRSLWRQRNFITQFFPEGSHVVSMDDDLEEFYKLEGEPLDGGHLVPLHPGGFVDIIRDAWKKMHISKTFLWSLNVSDNPGFMRSGRVTLRNGNCNGYIWGCYIRHDARLRLRYGDGHEDVERSVRYFQLDGAVLRYREFCAKTHCKTNDGGLQSSMSKTERKVEEERSVELLVKEFPLLLRNSPGSKLGVKFTHPENLMREHNVLSPSLFQRVAARKLLPLLVGARGACKTTRKLGGVVPFFVEHVRQDLDAIVLNTCKGFLVAELREFNEALTQETLFIFWLPPDTCDQLGVKPSWSVESIPPFLQLPSDCKVGVGIITCSGSTANTIFGENKAVFFEPTREFITSTLAAPSTGFASYLDTIDFDDGLQSDDEEYEGVGCERALLGSTPTQAPQDSASPGNAQLLGMASVTKKRKKKHEDDDWVRSQEHLWASALECKPASPLCVPKRWGEVDVVGRWMVTGSLEGVLSHLASKRSESSPRLQPQAYSVWNPLFCASRIWGGGWGVQCTATRLQGYDYCKSHLKELLTQRYLTHGRFDGEIPPKKKVEFDKWLPIISADLTKSSESNRAYQYRTGDRGAKLGRQAKAGRQSCKRPAAAESDKPPKWLGPSSKLRSGISKALVGTATDSEFIIHCPSNGFRMA